MRFLRIGERENESLPAGSNAASARRLRLGYIDQLLDVGDERGPKPGLLREISYVVSDISPRFITTGHTRSLCGKNQQPRSLISLAPSARTSLAVGLESEAW